jgi:hypothetical protein
MEKPQNLKNTKSHKKQRGIGKDKIQRSPDCLSKEMMDELDKRYQFALEHPEDWLSWEKVKSSLLREE